MSFARPRWARPALLGSLALAFVVFALDVALDHVIGPRLVRGLVRDAMPWPTAEVRLGTVRLRGVRSLELADLAISIEGDRGTLALDRVDIAFRPTELVGESRRVRSVRLQGLRAEASASEDGWAWLSPPSRPRADRPTTVDRLELSDASLRASSEAGLRLLTAFGVEGEATEIGLGRTASIDFERTAATADAPAWRGGPVEVTASGALAAGAWHIRAVELTDSSGSRLTVTGSVGPRAGSDLPLALDLRGNLRLEAVHPIAGRASGTVVARLDVTEPRAPSGRVDVDMRTSGATATVSGGADLRGGEVVLDLRADGGHWSGEMRGAVDPVAEALAYDLELKARVDGDTAGAATGEALPPWRLPWEATAHLSGSGSSADSATATLVEHALSGGADLSWDLDARELHASAELEADGQSVTPVGRWHFDGDGPAIAMDDLRALQPYVKGGYGYAWYRVENVRMNGTPIADPTIDWIGPRSIWPNVWHYGLGTEIMLRRGSAAGLAGIDIGLRVEYARYPQTLDLDLSGIPLEELRLGFTTLGDVPDESVTRDDFVFALTMSF